MSFWDNNLTRLAARQPELAEQIRHVPLHNIRLMTNAAGDIVGQTWDVETQQWVVLCDPNDPHGEAERDAAALWTREARIFCCFGMGLGYFPAAFAKRLLPHQRMAIFDPNPMHYVGMMHAVDAEPLQGAANVETFIGDQLTHACEQWWLGLQSHEKFHIAMPMRSGFTNVANVSAYTALMQKTEDMLRYHAVGLATWRQFGRHIGYSDWGNLPEYMVTPGFQELKDKWQGKPAVCIAAGPSLRKNLALLQNPAYRSKVAVITVGTCYALLQALGITPDIVCTIDFQRLNWSDQFLHVPLDQAPALVYLHSTYPDSVRRWPGPRFVGLNSSDTTIWMAQFAEPKAGAGQVQSVAHLNLVVAQMLGASPILLLGQDLSMTRTEHHALGARAQDAAPDETDPEAHIEMPGYDGQPVWSRHSMLSMKVVFEQLIATTPGQQIINCTEGGLALVGVGNAPLRDVLDQLPTQTESLAPLVAATYANYTPAPQWGPLTEGIATMLRDLDVLEVTARTVVQQSEGWDALPAEERPARYAEIQQADGVYQQLGLAFGQIAIRRFDVIELLSAIPPAPDTDEEAMREINVQRLRTVSAAIADDIGDVRQIIQRAQKRLLDLQAAYDDSKAPDARWLARQSFAAFVRAMRDRDVPVALLAGLAWHQQRYAAVLAFADSFPVARRWRRRTQRLLDRHQQQLSILHWQYFAKE